MIQNTVKSLLLIGVMVGSMHKVHTMDKIHFEKVTIAHEKCIFDWLEKPHVQEFWDNSQKHRDDIINFVNSRKEICEGLFDYWVGSIEGNSFCLVMTSEILSTSNVPDVWKTHLSKTGKTLSLDFMIGNENYLGKGLAAPTLEEFTLFIKDKIDKSVDTFFIDPNENNPRAKHVYAKAGFKVVTEFIRNGDRFSLMVKAPGPITIAAID